MDKILLFIKEIDIKTLYLINHGLKNEFLDYVMTGISIMSYGLVLVPLFSILLYVIDKEKFKYNFIVFITALLIGALLVQVFKPIIPRPRPLKEFPDLYVFSEYLRERSFPSGHTQAASTAAVFLLKKIRKVGVYFISFFFIIAVGLSRIYLASHYLSDIIAGTFLGAVLTIIVYRIFQNRLNQPIKSDPEVG